MSSITTRHSTQVQTARSQAEPRGGARRVLPIEVTGSLHRSSEKRVVDREITRVKTEYRFLTYFVDATAEKVHNSCFSRGRTSLQGATAPKGWQAGHGCFAPATKDNCILNTVEYAIENGLTPTKTKPFLTARLNLGSEEISALEENFDDVEYVKKFVADRLPPNGLVSIFSTTRYEEKKNATFANPTESNEYDSDLEREIAPFLQELQASRFDETVEESMEKLVAWLEEHYTQSIVNITHQIENIQLLGALMQEMRNFEKANLQTKQLDGEEFEQYLNNVTSFLNIHEDLMQTKRGRPKCHALDKVRPDFRNLRRLRQYAEESAVDKAEQFFLNNRRHLAKDIAFDAEFFAEKYTLYLDEATAQQEVTNVYAEPCTIPNMRKMLFGMMENNVLRVPTELELQDQIFALSQIATPYKEKTRAAQKTKRDAPAKRKLPFESPKKSNQESPHKPKAAKKTRSNPSLKRTLSFEEHPVAKKVKTHHGF